MVFARATATVLALLLGLLSLSLLSTTPVDAHASCCMKKLLPYIPDPDAAKPEVDERGEPLMIVDPNPENVRPDDWSDEDDGEWEPNFIENPAYIWRAPLVPNPKYHGPPALLDSFVIEVLKATPWVVLGLGVTAVLELAQLSVRALQEQLRRAGTVQGALVGLATPLCSCGALPVAAGFVGGQVPLNVVVAFLTATQSAGLDSAAITWGLLGPSAALWRLAGAIVLSIGSGMAVPSSYCRAAAATTAAPYPGQGQGGAKAAAGGDPHPHAHARAPAPAAPRSVRSLCEMVVGLADDVFPSVLLGLCLSTVALHLAPQLATTYASLQVSGALVGSPALPGWGRSLLTRLAVLAASLPLQLCEHTTVAYAAAIQKAGGPPGLAFAFLLVAPATNLPSLVLLLKASGAAGAAAGAGAGSEGSSSATWRHAVVWRVAAALTLGALLLSYVVDALGVDLLVEKEADEGGGTMLELPAGYVMASHWVAGALLAAVVVRRLSSALWGGQAAAGASAGCADCCDGKDKTA